MRQIFLILLLSILSLNIYSDEININRSLEETITKNSDQDREYSSYEKSLRKTQKSVDNKLLHVRIIRMSKSQHLREVK